MTATTEQELRRQLTGSAQVSTSLSDRIDPHAREHARLWQAVGTLIRAVDDLRGRAYLAAGLDPRSPRYSLDRRTLRGAITYELRRKGRQRIVRHVPGAKHVYRAAGFRRRYQRNPAGAVAGALFRQPLNYIKTLLFLLFTVLLVVWLLYVAVIAPIKEKFGWIIPGSYGAAPASCGPRDVRAGGYESAAWELGHRITQPGRWETDPARIRAGLWDAVGNAGQAAGWVKRGIDGLDAPTERFDPAVYAQTSSGACAPCPDSGAVQTVTATGGSEAALPLDAARAVKASPLWSAEPADVQRIAVAVAVKESSDNPRAVNRQAVVLKGKPNRAHGLWQVMLPLHADKLRRSEALDPDANAKAAHAIYRSQGWQAWDVAQDGSYREALDAAGEALDVVGGVTPDPGVCAAAAGTAVPVGAPAVPAGPAVETAVAYALAQRGKPYEWGARPDDEPGLPAPATFDCSSLLDSAYLAAGIELPGRATTRSLLSMGTPVSRDELRRGDLVWTSSGHIGMALDADTIVHAPQTGDVVKVSKLWAFHTARRVVTNGVSA